MVVWTNRRKSRLGDRTVQNFHPVLNVVWTESCLDAVSNLQLGFVCKRLHTADRTGQNCSVSNILRTIENSLDLSPNLSYHWQNKSLVHVGCQRGITMQPATFIELYSRLTLGDSKLRHLVDIIWMTNKAQLQLHQIQQTMRNCLLQFPLLTVTCLKLT